MHAIQTKYHCPTNTRGARISARFTSYGGPEASIPYPYELDHEGRHTAAAKELIAKYAPELRIVESASIPLGYIFIAR